MNHGKITSFFGKRDFDFHYGVDVDYGDLADVFAPASGRVVFGGKSKNPGYRYVNGKLVPFEEWLVVIDDGKSYYHVAGHLAPQSTVGTNAEVRKGDPIGKQDTGPASHVHRELLLRLGTFRSLGEAHVQNWAVDPLKYLTLAQLQGGGELTMEERQKLINETIANTIKDVMGELAKFEFPPNGKPRNEIDQQFVDEMKANGGDYKAVVRHFINALVNKITAVTAGKVCYDFDDITAILTSLDHVKNALKK